MRLAVVAGTGPLEYTFRVAHPDKRLTTPSGSDLGDADIESRRFTWTSVAFGIGQGFILFIFLYLIGAPFALAVFLGVLNSAVGMYFWRRVERRFLLPYAHRAAGRWVEMHGRERSDAED